MDGPILKTIVQRHQGRAAARSCQGLLPADSEHRGDNLVKQYLSCLAAGSLLLSLSAGHLAWAQKHGGILRLASPARRSLKKSKIDNYSISYRGFPKTCGQQLHWRQLLAVMIAVRP